MAYKIKDKDGRPVVTKDGENILRADIHKDFELIDFSDKERSFLAVASTDTPDRFKDIIEVDGWELKNYRKNPVLMAFHAYHTLPVGRSLEEFADVKGKTHRLMFRPQFANYLDTMRMYEMYRDKFLKGFSVGFLPIKSEPIKDDKKKKEDDHPFWHTPTRFKKQELLENSVAPVPANPDALSEIRTMVKKGSLYVPAKYLQEEQKPELEAYDDYIHVKVEDEDRFTILYEDEVAEGVTRVFGLVEDEDEPIDHKYIFAKDKFDEEQAMGSMNVWVEESYPDGEAMKPYISETYNARETVLVDVLPVLDEKAFEEAKRKELDVGDSADNAKIATFKYCVCVSSCGHWEDHKAGDPCADHKCPDCGKTLKGSNEKPKKKEETECEFCLEEPDKEYTVGEDIEFTDEEYIDEKDVEEKPYPNEHACRILPPGDFDRFARKNCFRKSGGKCIDFIFGVKAGKSKVQAMRYKKTIWTAAAAKAHCSGKGTFEAAGKDTRIFVYTHYEMLEETAAAELKARLQAILPEDATIIMLDPGATLADVKGIGTVDVSIKYVSKEEIEDDKDSEEEKRIGGNKDLPTDPETDWDTRAVVTRMRKWSGGPEEADMDWKKYKQGFVWYDSADPKNFKSYKLPFADIIDDTLKAKWGGVYRAMAVVLGARGGVDISESQRKRAYKFLKSYYAKFEKPAPDYKNISEDPAIYEMICLVKDIVDTLADEVVDKVVRAVRSELEEAKNEIEDEDIAIEDIEVEPEEEEEAVEDEINISKEDVEEVVSTSLNEALGRLD